MKLWRRALMAAIALAAAIAPTPALAAVDILESTNTAMGQITTDNLFEDPTLIQRYSNRQWEYVSTYNDTTTTTGSATSSGNEAAHTITGTNTIPSYKITTAAYNGYYNPPNFHLYTSQGLDQGGNYEWQGYGGVWGSSSLTDQLTIHNNAQTHTVATYKENLSLSVPKVTVSGSTTFEAQDTRVGVFEPYLMRLDVSDFTANSSTAVYLSMSFGSAALGKSLLFKGDVIRAAYNNRPIRVDNSYSYTGRSEFKLYGYWGTSYHLLEPDASGKITIEEDCPYLIYVLMVNGLSITSANKYLYVNKPECILYRDYALEQQTDAIGQQTQEQTDTLMSTDGADGIGGQIQNKGQEIVQAVPVVGQLSQQTEDIKAILTTDSEDGFTWPGVQYGEFVIPPVTVDWWSFLPDLKEPTRWFTTFIFVSQFLEAMYQLVWVRIFGVQDLNAPTDGDTQES